MIAFCPLALYHPIPGPDKGNNSSGSYVALFAALVEDSGFPFFFMNIALSVLGKKEDIFFAFASFVDDAFSLCSFSYLFLSPFALE